MENEELSQLVEELDSRLERLRVLYDQYFMGIEKIPPFIVQKDVDRRIWVLRREKIRNTGTRFRFQQIVQKYNTFSSYWMRICRDIENGTYKRDVIRAKKRFGDAADPKKPKQQDAGVDVEVDVSFELEDDELEILGEESFDEYDASALDAPPEQGYDTTKVPVAARANPSTDPAPAPLISSRPAGPRAKAPVLVFDDESDETTQARFSPPQAKPASPLPQPRSTGPVAPTPPRAPLPQPSPSRPPATPARPPLTQPSQTGSPRTSPAASPLPTRAPLPQPSATDPTRPPLPFSPQPPAQTRAPLPQPSPSTAAPQPRPAQGSPSPPRPEPAQRPAVAASAASSKDDEFRQVYSRYVEMRRKNGESTAGVTYEGLSKNLRETSEKLKVKAGGKKIDFEVVVKDGKTILKPTVAK